MARKKKRSSLSKFWKRFAFKHTSLAVVAITLFILALDTTIVQAFLNEITALEYIGIFITGILFVSLFTAAPAVALLLAFGDTYNPLVVAAIAGLGAMIGDYIILRFAEDKIAKELKPIAKRLQLMNFINLLHRKRFKPLTATVGAIVIASPFPDEAGVALLGLSRISNIQLLGLTYILNTSGIAILLLAFN